MSNKIKVGEIYKNSNGHVFYQIVHEEHDMQICTRINAGGLLTGYRLKIAEHLASGELILSSSQEVQKFINAEMQHMAHQLQTCSENLIALSEALGYLDSNAK